MELTPFFFGLYKFVKYGLYPLTWVVLLLGAATVLALFPFSPTRLRWVRRLAITSLLLLVTISNPLVAASLMGSLESWYQPAHLSPSDRFDAIVVLGGGVNEKGSLRPAAEPTSYSRNRTTCGVDLFQQGHAPTVVLTGGDARVFGTGPKEAVEMQRWAVRLGVPESATMVDTDARNTYENATGTKRLIGPASILLVSSAGHLPRAVPVFTKQGFRVTPAPCDYASQDLPQESWKDIDLFDFMPSDGAIQHNREVVTELAGIVIYWLAGKL
ncbi:MAG: YdcF family protein [Nitrospirota bacterium]|nr:YdcF family protein [Nitrospirota bacterium]